MRDNPQVLRLLEKAVIEGMLVVRRYQGRPTEIEIKKADKTFVTKTDKLSEVVMLRVLSLIPDVDTWSEESKATDNKHRYLVLVDPLDGTSAFLILLMTSTITVGLYDRELKQIIACVVGEPTSGRIWVATADTPTKMYWYSYGWRRYKLRQGVLPLQWADRMKSLDFDHTVFLDVSHGFKEILSHDQMRHLLSTLSQKAKVLIPGSNLLIQSLVASGPANLAGSISTAKGGPWDLVGGLLVKQAGGSLRGLKKIDGRIIPWDPLDSLDCDILVSANSEPIAEELAGMVLAL